MVCACINDLLVHRSEEVIELKLIELRELDIGLNEYR